MADDKLFSAENFDDLPRVWQQIIDTQHGLPCDGGGVPGEWCNRGLRHCYWFGGEEQHEEDEDDEAD